MGRAAIGEAEWRRIGLSPPPSVVKATAEYLENKDDLLAWVAACCTAEPIARVTSTDLYRSWKAWAERTGRRGGAGSQKAFGQALEDKGYPKERGRKGAVFLGLMVIDQDETKLGF